MSGRSCLDVRAEKLQTRPWWQAVRERHMSMTIACRVSALDNEKFAPARFAPFAAENLGCVSCVARFTVGRLKPAPTILRSVVGAAFRRPIERRPEDAAQTIGERAHADTGSAARPAVIKSRMRRATIFASGPVFPTGPTQPGHPCWHSHPVISSRVRASRSSCI